MEKVKVHLVLLGTQLHMSTIKKLSNYKSDLFCIQSTSSISTLPNTDAYNWSYSKQLLSSLFIPDETADITIAIIENRLDGNCFACNLENESVLVTFYQADTILRDANIDLLNYLLLILYKASTIFLLSKQKMDNLSASIFHDQTKGCLFDIAGTKHDLIHSASKAHLCPECEACLGKASLPTDFIYTLKKELKKIRKSKYFLLTEFIKQNPILSLIITILFSISINILSSFIFECIK